MTDINQQLNAASAILTKVADLSDKDLDGLSDSQKLELANSLVEEMKHSEPGQGKINLIDPQSVDLLKSAIEELELSYDPPLARDFVKKLSQRIAEENSKIPGEFLLQYEEFILRAKFLCLDLLEEDDIADLLHGSLIKYLQLSTSHIDVIEKLRQSLIKFVWPPDASPFIHRILKELESSQEVLGSRDIMMAVENGQRAYSAPTVSNWLKDYLSFQAGLKLRPDLVRESGSTFGRVSYINRVVSNYKLSSNQKEILVKVLEFTDWLQFGWAQEYENESKQTFVPEVIKEVVEDVSQRDLGVSQAPREDLPQVVTNENAFRGVANSEIKPSSAGISFRPVSLPTTIKPPEVRQPAASQVLKSSAPKTPPAGPTENLNLGQEMISQGIDKKLEELKKRGKNNP